jgi:hypothetical protein
MQNLMRPLRLGRGVSWRSPISTAGPAGYERQSGQPQLLAAVPTEKYRRALITYMQSLLGGTFLQFPPVR